MTDPMFIKHAFAYINVKEILMLGRVFFKTSNTFYGNGTVPSFCFIICSF